MIDDEIKNTKDVVNVVNVEFNGDDSKNNENLRSTIEELFKNINGKSTDQVLINNTPSSYYEAAIGKNQNYFKNVVSCNNKDESLQFILRGFLPAGAHKTGKSWRKRRKATLC